MSFSRREPVGIRIFEPLPQLLCGWVAGEQRELPPRLRRRSLRALGDTGPTVSIDGGRLKVLQDAPSALHDALREARESGHLDTVAVAGSAGDKLTQEDDIVLPTLHRDRDVANPVQRAGELRELVVVRREEGPSAEELKDAKTYLTGNYPLRFTSSSAIADMLVGMQEDKLGIDYIDKRNSLIEAVTLQDAKRVAKRLYQPEKLTFVIAGRPVGVIAN